MTTPNRDRLGFTLIELLLVVVIIGILAAIAIPQFANTKRKAYQSEMITDLRNLITAQEAFYSDSNTYYNGAVPATGFPISPSQGVSITLSSVSASGWGATATHIGTSQSCAVYHGNGGPLGPATVEGIVMCTP
jgi:prepilin-type N-terminal cleavage/methylation domain-containing protein